MHAAPLDLTAQEAIPAAGVRAALALLESGKLHRYGEASSVAAEASLLEAEFAQSLGVRYAVGMNSCGSTMFVALKALGVRPGDVVLSNCFTLAPVPGAVAHAGATLRLVDITDELTIDLDDLERKTADGAAKVLLLSHMRGHIADMERVMRLCDARGIAVVEDCAHTMGAAWAARPTGTWGRVGCFSVQSYKHANGGEGGLLVTDDEDVAAQAILYSGSYMHWPSHRARPGDAVFARWSERIPNFSLRMSNLVAAIVRPQLGDALADRCRRWNQRHDWLAAGLAAVPGVRLPRRPARERYVQSSIQFSLTDLSPEQVAAVVAEAGRRGVHVKWFGAPQAAGFTSTWVHWRYADGDHRLPNAHRIMAGLCDLRIPLALTQVDCDFIVATVAASLHAARISQPRSQ